MEELVTRVLVSCVLQSPVAEVQLRSGHPDIWLEKRTDQLGNPSVRDHVDVVVESDDELAGAVQCTEVYLFAEVEGLLVLDEDKAVSTELVQLGEDGRWCRRVVDDDHLEVVVASVL